MRSRSRPGFFVALTLVLLPLSLREARADAGLPAAGANVLLNAVGTGLEAGIEFPANSGYTDARVISYDAEIAELIETHVVKSQIAPASVKRIIVRIKNGGLRHGLFPITVIAEGAPKGVSLERDLWLSVPEATLDPPQSLEVVKVCYGIFFRSRCRGLETIDANDPQLWESSRQRWLTRITLTQKGDTVAGDEPAGIMVAKDSIADAPPGTAPRLVFERNLALNGGFPLGTAKGKLAIQAAQLASPVVMDFEIRSRLTTALLVLVLVVGFLVGWGTRVGLQGRKDLNQERQKPFALIAMVKEWSATTEDAAFQDRAAQIRGEATTAAEASTPADVARLTDIAQKHFVDLQSDFRAQRAELDQWYSDALTILRAPWRVSIDATTAIGRAKSAIETSLAKRSKNDLTRERDDLNTALAEANAVADSEANRSVETQTALDAFVPVLVPLLDSAAAGAFKPLRKPNAAPSATAMLAPPKVRIDSLHAALEYCHVTGSGIDEAVGTAVALFGQQLDAWDSQLQAVRLPQVPIWSAWLGSAREFIRALDQARPVSAGSLSDLELTAKGLATTLNDALRAQVTDADRPALESQLDKAGYADAIATVIWVNRPRRPIDRRGSLEAIDTVSDDSGQRSLPARGLVRLMLVGSGPTAPTLGLTAIPGLRDDYANVAILAAASQRTLQVTSWLLTLIYGTIIVLGGYFLFADKWLGTPLDVATAFFWAYATDIGADAATAVVRGFKK